ncbi:hypothetical protein RKD27_008018 [Streptomyces sp. SAI-126]
MPSLHPTGRRRNGLPKDRARDPKSLADATRAWELGGADALLVLEEEWVPSGGTLARARAALEAAWDEDERPSFTADGNRWTVVDAPTQLRLGRDGRWWPYRREAERWIPAGPAALDPATALASIEFVSAEPQR